jgi:rhodanese-related sulfurtransferase
VTIRQRTPFRRIDLQEFDHRRRDDALVLDVRNARAFHESHIDGALHVSHANVSALIDGTARNKPILIYCYHGNASQEFGQLFSDFGFCNVYSLEGGYEAWRSRQDAVEKPATAAALQHWLVEQGFPPEGIISVIANATTPLMKAAHSGDSVFACLLIEQGALFNARNADGNNALWLAWVGRYLDMIDLLVEAGIDINNRNDNGATALMYAASAGIATVVERLLARGADIAPETLHGFTALDMAATMECLALPRKAGHGKGVANARQLSSASGP